MLLLDKLESFVYLGINVNVDFFDKSKFSNNSSLAKHTYYYLPPFYLEKQLSEKFCLSILPLNFCAHKNFEQRGKKRIHTNLSQKIYKEP